MVTNLKCNIEASYKIGNDLQNAAISERQFIMQS